MVVQYEHGRCRSDAKTFLNLSSGNPGFGPDAFFRCLDDYNRNNSRCCAAALLIIQTPPASSKFIKPERDLGSLSKVHSCQSIRSDSQGTSRDVSPSRGHRTS